MIKIFAAMLLSACVVVSLGQQLVLWCIIETQDSDISEFSDVVFTTIKPGKFESVPTFSELQAANLGILQVAIGEACDTLMNPSPTQSNSYYSTQSVTNV